MILFLKNWFEENLFPIIIISFSLPFILIVISSIFSLFYSIKQKFKKKNIHGYIVLPNGNFEHREIVESLIKRKLNYGEEVHHINRLKWDNRKRNLALMTSEEHKRWHRKLEWMWSKRYKTTLRWQHRQLVEEFGARLF